jgi:hypothetical protein
MPAATPMPTPAPVTVMASFGSTGNGTGLQGSGTPRATLAIDNSTTLIVSTSNGNVVAVNGSLGVDDAACGNAKLCFGYVHV